MLRKSLSILCLTTITTLSQCMYSPSAPPVDEPEYVSAIYPTARTEDPAIQFNNLLEGKNEHNIIAFLKANHAFGDENLSVVLEKVFQLNLMQVVKYIRESFIVEDQDLVRCALKAENILWIKEFTQFDDYVDKRHEILYGDTYLAENVSKVGAGSLAPAVLHAIIIHNGINYNDEHGDRYLQNSIRSGQNRKALTEFIQKASLKQLNAKEENTGSTALHEAAAAWERYKNLNDNEQMHFQEFLIRILLEHGANPNKANKYQVRPNDFEFFIKNQAQCRSWQANYQRSKLPKTTLRSRATVPTSQPEVMPKIDVPQNTVNKRSRNSVSFLKLTGSALAGALVFYLGYKIFNNSHNNQSVRFR